MGELIRLPSADLSPGAASRSPILRRVIRSYRDRHEAERAAARLAGHLAHPDLIAVSARPGRFRSWFDLAVGAHDAERAHAVLELADRL
jgi:hypothetical protein